MDIWAQRLYYQSARSLLCSPSCASILSLLYSFTLSVLLYQSHCFCCALKHSPKLTCWILNWDIKPQGSSIQRKLFYILSLWKLFMFITWCTRWISTQRAGVPHLKSATRLQRRKPFLLRLTDKQGQLRFEILTAWGKSSHEKLFFYKLVLAFATSYN